MKSWTPLPRYSLAVKLPGNRARVTLSAKKVSVTATLVLSLCKLCAIVRGYSDVLQLSSFIWQSLSKEYKGFIVYITKVWYGRIMMYQKS